MFIYDVEGYDPIMNEDGTVKEIRGEHKRVGKLSDRMIRQFKLQGVPQSRFDFMLKDPNPEVEVETYTGKNIDHYGLDKVRKE